MLKGCRQDNVSWVFESVFHAGRFYRAIQSQDVREIRGGGRGPQCQESDRVTGPARCLSVRVPAPSLVTGCEVSTASCCPWLLSWWTFQEPRKLLTRCRALLPQSQSPSSRRGSVVVVMGRRERRQSQICAVFSRLGILAQNAGLCLSVELS